MRKTAISILIFTISGAPAAGWAAGQMKPGLWEMSMKSDAFKNMPKMSAQQREQMRKMGVTVPQMQDGAIISKVCVTPQMAEREQPTMARNEIGCQPKNYQRSGNSYSVEVVCDGAAIKGTGMSKGTFSGNTSFTASHDFKGTSHGQPINSRHENSGKWLSADCGNVKPIAEMQPKKP